MLDTRQVEFALCTYIRILHANERPIRNIGRFTADLALSTGPPRCVSAGQPERSRDAMINSLIKPETISLIEPITFDFIDSNRERDYRMETVIFHHLLRFFLSVPGCSDLPTRHQCRSRPFPTPPCPFPALPDSPVPFHAILGRTPHSPQRSLGGPTARPFFPDRLSLAVPQPAEGDGQTAARGSDLQLIRSNDAMMYISKRNRLVHRSAIFSTCNA